MFMWMFIEGLYLHNVVTVTVLQGRFPHMIYAMLGWGLPAIMTIIWAVFTAHFQRRIKYAQDDRTNEQVKLKSITIKKTFTSSICHADAGGATISHPSIGY